MATVANVIFYFFCFIGYLNFPNINAKKDDGFNKENNGCSL